MLHGDVELPACAECVDCAHILSISAKTDVYVLIPSMLFEAWAQFYTHKHKAPTRDILVGNTFG